MNRHTPFRLASPEGLERRDVPALFGQPWADPATLSVSIVPDGTAVLGGTSRLAVALAGIDVKAVAAEAVQAWAAHADLDFHFVPDGGQPIAAPGAPQGDGRFGDIRLAGADLGRDALAVAAPQEAFLSGTFSGDILINQNATFDRDRLLSVLLQETGHALGLRNSSAKSSVMYPFEHSHLAPSAADAAAVRALYGERDADPNESRTEATWIGRNEGDESFKAGDLTTGDTDVFVFRASASVATVSLRADGLSLLRGRLTVLDASGATLATADAAAAGADVSLGLSGLRVGRRYFVRVEGAAAGAFAVGRYAVVLTEPGDAPVGAAELRRLALAKLGTVGTLVSERDTDGGQVVWVHSAPGGLAQIRGTVSGEEDRLRLTAPEGLTGGSLTVSLVLPEGGAMPAVEVRGERGRVLASEVLVNAEGQLTLRVDGVTAGQRYTVRVRGAGGSAATPYLFVSQFSAAPVRPTTFLSGRLAPSEGRGSLLAVKRTTAFQFTLTASGGPTRVVIRDGRGRAVMTLDVKSGQTRTAEVGILKPGLYTVTAKAAGDGERGLTLSGVAMTDPIGPGFTDPTVTPSTDAVGDPFTLILPLGITITDGTQGDVWYIPGLGDGPPIYIDPVSGLPLDWGQLPAGYLTPWWVPPPQGGPSP